MMKQQRALESPPMEQYIYAVVTDNRLFARLPLCVNIPQSFEIIQSMAGYTRD